MVAPRADRVRIEIKFLVKSTELESDIVTESLYLPILLCLDLGRVRVLITSSFFENSDVIDRSRSKTATHQGLKQHARYTGDLQIAMHYQQSKRFAIQHP